MKKQTLTRAAALVATFLVASGLLACTNTEQPAGSSAETAAGSESSLGAGGRAIADAVQADPTIVDMVPEDIRTAGRLSLVTDPTYAPIDFTDEQGEIVGLEPDIAVAVAARMGLEVEIAKGDFNGILAGLESRRYDASFAAFSITPERTDVVDMVSFFSAGTSLMTPVGKAEQITSIDDLCGLTVTVQTGTTQALDVLPDFESNCADKGLDEIDALIVPQQDSANQAIASGRADVMIADNALVAYYTLLQPEAYAAVPGITVEPALIGVAMPKREDGLAEAFQAALQSLMDDGTLDEILAAWNLQDSAVDTAEINPIG